MSETKNPIRIGIWGLGRAGWGMHCPELDKFKDEFEIVAACDIDKSRLAEFAKRYPNAKIYSDGDAFLADENMEMTAVAVRSPEHTAYAIRALKTDKYVLIEKPLALTSAAVNKLALADKAYPGKLFCRHNRRFEPCFNHVLEIMNSGILGEVYEIKLCRHGYQFRNDWQTVIDCGGGQLNNWGPHLLDHSLQLMQAPIESVWSDLKKVACLGDAEDHLKIVFRGENGRIIDVEISGGVAIGAPVYTVYGTRGSLVSDNECEIRLKYLEPSFRVPTGKPHRESPPMTASFGGSVAPVWVEKTIKTAPANKFETTEIYHHLYEAIREGVPFPVKNWEAFEVVRTAEKIKRQNKQFRQMQDNFSDMK